MFWFFILIFFFLISMICLEYARKYRTYVHMYCKAQNKLFYNHYSLIVSKTLAFAWHVSWWTKAAYTISFLVLRAYVSNKWLFMLYSKVIRFMDTLPVRWWVICHYQSFSSLPKYPGPYYNLTSRICLAGCVFFF